MNNEEKGSERVTLSLWRLILNNFFGGIAWGFGSIIGATILVAFAVFLFNQLGGVPYLGGLLGEIIEQAQSFNGQ